MRCLARLSLALLTFTLLGCGGEPETLQCPQNLVAFRGNCVDPAKRYEPATGIDTDNVVAYGEPLSVLKLPDPPKSGFRIVAPPRTLEPGGEVDFCLSWPIPELQRTNVHAARLYTTPGLHHSNVVAKPIEPDLGPNPYPDCHAGADDPFSNIGAGIPDVLFANSTQVVGEESILFPEGMGYHLDTTREITTGIHYLNATTEPLTIEVAYDFFTMPTEELHQEVAPFVVQIEEFSVAPHTKERVAATCDVFGGNVVSLMPHTHDLAEDFTVDLHQTDGSPKRIYEDGAFDLDSDIRTYNPGFSLDNVTAIEHACYFNNRRDIEVHYGIGLNEMCLLFGYIYPPAKQFAGVVSTDGGKCSSIQLGLFR